MNGVEMNTYGGWCMAGGRWFLLGQEPKTLIFRPKELRNGSPTKNALEGFEPPTSYF